MGDNKYKKEANQYKPIDLNHNAPMDMNFERMLKTFLKDVAKSRILQELKERRYYIKPSAKKRLEQNRRRRK